ncbi:MAG TPA: hypothetical protein VF755_00805, partial [Catenuloplanes sp.]
TLSLNLERHDSTSVTAMSALAPVVDQSNNPVPYTPGGWLWFRMQVRGPVIRAAAYPSGSSFRGWDAQEVDTTLTAPGRVGWRALPSPGNWSATMQVDSFRVREPLTSLDLRVQLRPTADRWAIRAEHWTLTGQDGTYSGWEATFTNQEACLQVLGGDVFTRCVDMDRVGVVIGQRRWLRLVYELRPDTPAGRLDAYTSLDGLAWTLVHSDTDAPEPLDVDAGVLRLILNDAVTVSRAEIRNGANGPLIASADFAVQPPATTRFVDAQGNTWEVDGRGICATG